MTHHKSINHMRHLVMMLLTILIFAGCSKSQDIDIFDPDDEYDILDEYSLSVSDFAPGSWKITKFISDEGKTIDLNYSFEVNDISDSDISESTVIEYLNNIVSVTADIENSVRFNNPLNAENEGFFLSIFKKSSDKISKGKIYGISILLDNEVNYDNVVSTYLFCVEPNLKGKRIESSCIWTQSQSLESNVVQSRGTLIFEKQ